MAPVPLGPHSRFGGGDGWDKKGHGFGGGKGVRLDKALKWSLKRTCAKTANVVL